MNLNLFLVMGAHFAVVWRMRAGGTGGSGAGSHTGCHVAVMVVVALSKHHRFKAGPNVEESNRQALGLDRTNTKPKPYFSQQRTSLKGKRCSLQAKNLCTPGPRS